MHNYNFASIQKEINNNNRDTLCALLLANSRPRIASYIPLAEAITNQGHLCFIIHPLDSRPPSEELIGYDDLKIGYVPQKKIADLSGIDVFISSEVVRDVAPRTSVTVGLAHSLPDNGLTENAVTYMQRYPTLIRSLDYFIVAIRQSEATWTKENYAPAIQRIYPSAFLQDRRTTLDIVPGGYPKVEYIQHSLCPEAEVKYIIYAPTQRTMGFSEVEAFGTRIIECLLRHFPNFTIVFRPYPSDVKFCQERFGEFSRNPKFRLDDTVTGIEYQKHASVIVTDRSSYAVTFSISSGRPSVFVKLSGADDSAGTESFTPPTDLIGFRAEGLSQMTMAIEHCLQHRRSWHDRIMSERQKYLYQPGTASKYLADMLPVFAARKTHPDWVSVDRLPWLIGNSRNAAKQQLDRLHRTLKVDARPLAFKAYNEIRDYIEGLDLS